MRALAFLAASFVALATPPGAQASPVTHASSDAFVSIAYAPGTNSTLGQVAAERRVIANMFDGTNATMLSLGLGGSISFLIAPTENAIIGSTVFELTNLGSGHKERARLFLGNDLGDWIEIGTLLNQELGSQVTNLTPLVASLEVVAFGSATGFGLTVHEGSFNSLRLVDASPGVGPNLDGFDIATLSITSVSRPVAIPEPAAALALSVGLLGLAMAARARARA